MNAGNHVPPSAHGPHPNSVICHCFQITAHAIGDAMRNGASTVPQIRDITAAGKGCRGCNGRIERMLQGLPPCSLHCDHCGVSSLICSCAVETDSFAKAS